MKGGIEEDTKLQTFGHSWAYIMSGLVLQTFDTEKRKHENLLIIVEQKAKFLTTILKPVTMVVGK